jgi:hypothetical protein
MGVTLFRLSEGEQVTSVFPVLEDTNGTPDGDEIPPETPDPTALDSDNA